MRENIPKILVCLWVTILYHLSGIGSLLLVTQLVYIVVISVAIHHKCDVLLTL